MPEKTMLQRVSEETMRFMRGMYLLDELGNGKDQVKFRRSGKTVLTIDIREDRFEFLIIFGKAEREKFEAERDTFPAYIQQKYDGSKTYHDGKWMTFAVVDLATLEDMKRLILIKKKPNRRPFPKENAHYSRCGQRCDLCIHYTGGTISEEHRLELEPRLTRVYNHADWSMRCTGCDKSSETCEQHKCAREKAVSQCTACAEYPCDKAPVVRCTIQPVSTLADDVTYAVLPFVPFQYGN